MAIDPAANSGEEADETGIMVVGKDAREHGYVLADISGHYAPIEWARLAVAAYRTHRADRIIAERNNGGDMVEATIRMVDRNVPVTTVWTTRGKVVRAEPVSALYEQSRVHHIGIFPQLEDQMANFTSFGARNRDFRGFCEKGRYAGYPEAGESTATDVAGSRVRYERFWTPLATVGGEAVWGVVERRFG